jgi:hypothetical protein
MKIIIDIEKVIEKHEKQGYHPRFLMWATSYKNEVEEMRELILGEPADVKLLKEEYQELTGKRFRRRKDWT